MSFLTEFPIDQFVNSYISAHRAELVERCTEDLTSKWGFNDGDIDAYSLFCYVRDRLQAMGFEVIDWQYALTVHNHNRIVALTKDGQEFDPVEVIPSVLDDHALALYVKALIAADLLNTN